ncbi:MAG: AprI/Inh family metalloprotease inhibitor [Rhodobiaceae bacterium]|nr:AprI/Inh family metalloprotease inhibitor [Rhodobiaceae bacterium]MCC0053848.1 AprI/Inh family metalloprotease inhibitor [Rhodobiaceae bacterium]
MAAIAFLATEPARAAQFSLAGADGAPVCGLTLEPPAADAQPRTDASGNPLPTPGSVTVEDACIARFATLKDISGWLGGEGSPLVFVNAEGDEVVVFQDIGDGIRVGRFPAGGIAYLSGDAPAADGNADAGGGDGNAADGNELAGTWVFARGADGNTPLCTVAMSGEPANGDLSGLKPQAGCGEAIAVLDLAGWKLAGDTLSVHDSGGKERLTFSRQEGAVWIRDPAGTRPLFLIRTGD